jgi:UDP-glucose 4-epimerase
MMRVVVIGATGNIGTRVCAAFAGGPDPVDIIAVARRIPEMTASLRPVRFISADVASDDLHPIMEGADAVILLAWLIQPSHDPRYLEQANVEGTRRALIAAARAEVPVVVYGSSVGAYGPGPGPTKLVDESWPTDGIPGNLYSLQKSRTERLVDQFELHNRDVRTVRIRPALVFQRSAATGVRRLMMGPLAPTWLLAPGRIPFVPRIPGLVTQAVHSRDVAEAFRLAVVTPHARGPYNVAADPLLTPETMARALDSRTLPVPRAAARLVAEAAWRSHLQPMPGSWLDLAIESPLMDTTRIRRDLGWRPTRSATQALRELAEGIHDRADWDTPPLSRASSGRLRSREFATGVGSRDGALADMPR